MRPGHARLLAVASTLVLGPVTAARGGEVEVSGVVRDQETLAPIPGALVSLQASGLRTITGADGGRTAGSWWTSSRGLRRCR